MNKPAKAKKGLYEEFVQIYNLFIPESHKQFYAPQDLEIFLKARFEYLKSFTEPLKLEVYNPSTDYIWLANSTIVELVLKDSPFIVNTLLDYFNQHEIRINVIIHPVLKIQRDETGNLEEMEVVFAPSQYLESYVYLEVARQNVKDLARVKREILADLNELRAIVHDYNKMMSLTNSLVFENEAYKLQRDWLIPNFINLGMLEVKDGQITKPYLGLLKKSDIRRELEMDLETILGEVTGEGVYYRETTIISSVNTRRKLNFVLFKTDLRTILMVGHYANRTANAIRTNIPAIKQRLESMARDMHATPASFVYKELVKGAQLLPVEVFFTREKKFLSGMLSQLTENLYKDEPEFTFHVDVKYKMVWVLGIVPLSESGNSPTRLFEEFNHENDITIHLRFLKSMHRNEIIFIALKPGEMGPEALRDKLEENYERFFASWDSRFKKLIAFLYVGEKKIADAIKKFSQGMSHDFEVFQDPETALHDLEKLDNLEPGTGCLVDYYHKTTESDTIKIFTLERSSLSEYIPVLSNFAFVVTSEHTYTYQKDGETRFVHSFKTPARTDLENGERKRISESIAGVLNGKTTSDVINSLVTRSSINARELNLIKALIGYFYQIDKSYSHGSLSDTLLSYPEFSECLVGLFCARFDGKTSTDEMQAAGKRLEGTFLNVRSAFDEAICRAYVSIVNAVVRTNFFLDKHEIAFKIFSANINKLPSPVPLFEIYVFSNFMEGIHLRSGYVARGGLRWSDRTDDFRTEILGLMKAQMVKNTLIVPDGSKGGFVVKQKEFADRSERLAMGIEAYKRFINSLLDLTDNRNAHGKSQPAPDIKRLDRDDTYLVVAADKGTATFSDIANEISTNRKFWLTDAFASGGQFGYDHKKQGITARGAWESVRRHFHEMKKDPDKDNITVAGIGDMGGDVFGNGLLISRSVKLVAAFNHMYIFLDPNPDPEKSYVERKRLFDMVGNWDEYDKKLISKGGGIFDRQSRKIPLSEPIKTALGVTAADLNGEELIKAILKAPVDLLWNGGIGTYVKGAHENQYEAGDPSNDRVRVDGKDVRAKVIGEGGNLGMTQAGRIEAFENGVRVNTDAIDNSAGVDMSDHEVNLKILLNGLVKKKKINGEAERNKLIRKYDGDMIDLVLKHNFQNNLALSLDDKRVSPQFAFFRALIKFLNREGILSRENDSIPFEADLDRLEQGVRKFPRPVLCSLMGFTKLHIAKVFMESDAFKDPWYDRFVLRYFPANLTKTFKAEILKHPLKNEIIVTEVINEVINNAGIAFFQRMFMRSGTEPIVIADGYLRVSSFLHLEEIRESINSSGVPAELLYNYLILLEEKVFQITLKVLEFKELKYIVSRPENFVKVLEGAAEFSSYRFPRDLRNLYRTLDGPLGEKVLNAFKRVEALEDAFNIYINNNSTKTVWKVPAYFSTLEKFRIKELRGILASLQPPSRWEILFLSKIGGAIEELVLRIMNLSEKNGTRKRQSFEQKILTVIDDIITMNTRGHLSTAAFFEMLSYLNARIEAHE